MGEVYPFFAALDFLEFGKNANSSKLGVAKDFFLVRFQLVWRQSEFAFFGAYSFVCAHFLFSPKNKVFLRRTKEMNTLDYKTLYLEKYKKLPIYYFWSTLISVGIIATVIGIAFFWNYYPEVCITIITIGWMLGLAIAFFAQWISSVILSQSVVFADCLLEFTKQNADVKFETSTVKEDELPEL